MNKLFAFLSIALVIGCARQFVAPIKILETVTPDRYPDTDGVIVFDSTRIDVAASGRAVIRSHRMLKILSSFGKKRYGDLSFSYCSLYDTVIIERARVLSPDGKIYDVPKAEIKDIPLPTSEGSKFFIPNVRLKKITFPHLESGGAIEIMIRDELQHPPLANNFDTWEPFAGDVPIISKTFIITAPKKMELHWVVKNGEIKFSKKEEGDKVIYLWEAANVDRIVEEPSMPPLLDIVTKLLVATEPDYKTWSRWYYWLAKPSFAIDSAIETKVSELVKDKKTEDEKVRALFHFVSKNIRYVEMKLTGRFGGYPPAPAPTTFRNRIGVSRDKAALLVGMLTSVGVTAFIALTNPLMVVEKEVACDQFNHAIVAVRRPDGGYYYLDPAGEESRDYLMPLESDKPVLVCTPEGEDLTRTPFLPVEKNMFITEAEATLDAAGNISGKITMVPEGYFDFTFRMNFKQIPAGQHKQVFETIVRAITPNAEMTSFNISDITDLNSPLCLELNYRASDYGIKVEDEFHIEMPGGRSSNIGLSLGGQSKPWSLPERKYPLYLWSTLGSSSTETVTFPKGWTVKRLPDSLNLDYDRFAYHEHYSVNKNKITRQTLFVIKAPLIPLSDYEDFRSLMEKIEERSKQLITLRER